MDIMADSAEGMPTMKGSLSGHIGEFLDRITAYLDQQDGLKNIQAGIVWRYIWRYILKSINMNQLTVSLASSFSTDSLN